MAPVSQSLCNDVAAAEKRELSAAAAAQGLIPKTRNGFLKCIFKIYIYLSS